MAIKIQQLWYENKYKILFYILIIPSYIYRLIIKVRFILYQKNIFTTHKVNAKVIKVGNISVGGTGKTPYVMYLAEKYQKNHKVGIITRGYKGKNKNKVLLYSQCQDPKIIGDEAAMMGDRLKTIEIAICPNRYLAAQTLVNKGCDLIISDDGLQHYALYANIKICIVDNERKFGNKQCLPAGPLREPIHKLKHFDEIIYNYAKKPENPINKGFYLLPQHLTNLKDSKITINLQQIQKDDLIAIAGIGNPKKFFQSLKNQGLKFKAVEFPDHYNFTANDLCKFGDKTIIMTEKDAIKIKKFANNNYWYLRTCLKSFNSTVNVAK